MSTGFGDVAPAGATSWALAHPGVAALVAVLTTYLGVVAVGLGFAMPVPEAAVGASLWPGVLVLVGTMLFVAGLPAALGFAGACCATQRELVAGVVAGLAAVVVALVIVALVAPANGPV